jgi:hypothetical protein
VVISIELGRKVHNSIPTTAIRRRLKPLNLRTDPQTRLNGWWSGGKENRNQTSNNLVNLEIDY